MLKKNQSKRLFIPQKVLNLKKENHKIMVLIQWQGCGIEQATWQPAQKFDIDHLIAAYQKSKINDKQKNFAIKKTQQIVFGQNPYKQTQRHGHFMYGDQPESIESLKIFRNVQGSNQQTTIICQIKWKDRIQYIKQGDTYKQVTVLIQNSFIDSKMVNQFKPNILGDFYEQRIRLNVVGNKK